MKQKHTPQQNSQQNNKFFGVNLLIFQEESKYGSTPTFNSFLRGGGLENMYNSNKNFVGVDPDMDSSQNFTNVTIKNWEFGWENRWDAYVTS